jgi:AcrR family transcriptional regulator
MLAAARRVFERDGFLDARITDISAEANMAHGTFYKYFDSKEQVFMEVIERSQEELFAERPSRQSAAETPFERILETNRAYYEAYRRNRALNKVLEAVATFDDTLRQQRVVIRRRYVDRTEKAIRRWQAEGLASPHLDPHYAASSLGSMVDRTIYVWLVLGEDHDPDVGLDTLSRLWVRALGLPEPDPVPPRRKRRRST